MYVCICKSVTEQEIRDAVKEGEILSPNELYKLNVAQGCGSCLCFAEEILEEEFAAPQ